MKFEFGYVNDAHGKEKLIYMDEVGTRIHLVFEILKKFNKGQHRREF